MLILIAYGMEVRLSTCSFISFFDQVFAYCQSIFFGNNYPIHSLFWSQISFFIMYIMQSVFFSSYHETFGGFCNVLLCMNQFLLSLFKLDEFA